MRRGHDDEAGAVDRELAHHIERETARLLALGVPREEAERRAAARFGDLAALRRELTRMDARAARRAWRRQRWGHFLADVRHAGRLMRRRPVSAVVAILTLGLGIGGAATVAGVAWALLLRPLPFEGAESLVGLWSAGNWSRAELDVAREASAEWLAVAAHAPTQVTVRREDEPTRVVQAERVTDGLFEVLRARAARGRTLRAGDGVPGAAPVVVLSDALWRDAFGADDAIVGRTVVVDGTPREVVGVMPPAFAFPAAATRLWLPVTEDRATSDYVGNHYLGLVGRVAAHLDVAGARTRLPQLAERLRERFTYRAEFDKPAGASLLSLRAYLHGDPRPALFLLGTTVLLVLLIAGANVAALQVGRLAERRAELAVRAALGAGRGRLAAQMLDEGLLVGLLAGLVGGVLVAGAVRGAPLFLPADGAVALRAAAPAAAPAVAALTLLAGLLSGALPALWMVRGRLRAGLSDARGGIGGAGRAHGTLVSAELAIALVLVLGAGLLASSFARLSRADTGMDAENVVVVDVFAGAGDLDVDQRRAFLLEAAQRVERLPGVEAAATVQLLPLRARGWSVSVTTPDRPDLTGPATPVFFWRAVTPAFHDALRIPIVRGRAFRASDREGAPPVAIISRSTARALWPEGDALGRRIRTGVDGQAGIEVVGIAADIRVSDVRADPEPVVYRPVAQTAIVPPGHTLLVRTSGDPLAVVPAVRATLERLEPRVAIARIETMASVVRGTFAGVTRASRLVGAFALVALLLGGLGIYGVGAQLVARRTREFGLRLALGATPAQVRTAVVRSALVPVGAGVLVGLIAFFWLGRALRGFLFGVRPGDPALLAGSVLLLGTVALVALTGPAFRAARTDPARTLRAD